MRQRGAPLLLRAVRVNNTELADLCLKLGYNPNFVDMAESDEAGMPLERSLLHIAASEGSKKICELLIVAGAKLEAEDVDGKTPLLSAAQSGAEGAEDVVLLLLRCRANYLAHDSLENNCVHLAVLSENLNSLATILEAVGNRPDFDINGKNEDGDTPLHLAAAHSDKSMCLLLVKHGAKNTLNDEGQKPSYLTDDAELKKFLDNIPALLTVCSVQSVQRLSSNTPIRKLPRELHHLVAEMLLGKEGVGRQ